MDAEQQMARGESAIIYLLRDCFNRSQGKAGLRASFALSSLYEKSHLDWDLANRCLDSLVKKGFIKEYRKMEPGESFIDDVAVTLTENFLEMCRRIDEKQTTQNAHQIYFNSQSNELIDRKQNKVVMKFLGSEPQAMLVAKFFFRENREEYESETDFHKVLPNEKVSWDEVADFIEGREGGVANAQMCKSIYDSIRLVNRHAVKQIGVKILDNQGKQTYWRTC